MALRICESGHAQIIYDSEHGKCPLCDRIFELEGKIAARDGDLDAALATIQEMQAKLDEARGAGEGQ